MRQVHSMSTKTKLDCHFLLRSPWVIPAHELVGDRVFRDDPPFSDCSSAPCAPATCRRDSRPVQIPGRDSILAKFPDPRLSRRLLSGQRLSPRRTLPGALLRPRPQPTGGDEAERCDPTSPDRNRRRRNRLRRAPDRLRSPASPTRWSTPPFSPQRPNAPRTEPSYRLEIPPARCAHIRSA